MHCLAVTWYRRLERRKLLAAVCQHHPCDVGLNAEVVCNTKLILDRCQAQLVPKRPPVLSVVEKADLQDKWVGDRNLHRCHLPAMN